MKRYRSTPEGMVEDPEGDWVLHAAAEFEILKSDITMRVFKGMASEILTETEKKLPNP